MLLASSELKCVGSGKGLVVSGGCRRVVIGGKERGVKEETRAMQMGIKLQNNWPV
jgi:hypothetical protein